MELTELATLTLDAAGPPHLAAASGLAVAGDWLYVVADDELGLGVFERGASGPGRLVPAFDGALSDDHHARKAAKPDLEALAVLPGGRLLALGSGATPARQRGLLWRLAADGALASSATVIDLAPLYEALHGEFAQFNVEGVTATGDALVLGHRGDAFGLGNALVVLDLATAQAELSDTARLSAAGLRGLRPVALPDVLALSDVTTASDGRLLFSAIAEDAPNAYDDGPFSAAALGALALDGTVLACEAIEPPVKVEGIEEVGGALWCVTDGDDRLRPGRLLRAPLP